MKIPFFVLCFPVLSCVVMPVMAADDAKKSRDEMVHEDREVLSKDASWIYNDIEQAKTAAREENKPLMVVFRCIP